MKARASAGFCILAGRLQPAPNFRLLQQLGCSAVIKRTASTEFDCAFMAALSATLLVFKQAFDLEIVVTLASTLIE